MNKSQKQPSSLVSIVIPCFNGGEFVAETIQSVLSQTYENLELIVVNDGSTDNSTEVIKCFHDNRLVYIYQKNQGLSAARNTGIRHAKGEYLTFLDADDLFMSDKISNQLAFLDQNKEYGLVAQGFTRTDQRGKFLYHSIEKARKINLTDLVQSSQFPVHTALIRKEWIDRVGFFDTSLRAAEDWDYYCRLGIEGCKMYKQSISECTYRLLDNAMTTNAPRQTNMLLKVVEKTFSNPKLPTHLQPLKKKALWNTYLTGASRCLALNYFEEAIFYLKQLLEIDKVKTKSFDYEELIQKIAFFVKHMQVPDWKEKAALIIQNCGNEISFLNKIQKKLAFHIALVKSPNKKAYIIRQFFNNPLATPKFIADIISLERAKQKERRFEP